jgi:hypothetical protein
VRRATPVELPHDSDKSYRRSSTVIRTFVRGLGLAAFLVACSDASGPTAPQAPAGGPSLALGLASGASADTLVVGETLQLTAALPKRKGKATASATVWSSSNATAATVTQTGLVSALAAGSTVITAQNNLGSESATILVLAAAAPAPPPPPPAGGVTAPALPQAYVNTAPVTPTGATHLVRAGDDLQRVLNAAAPGDLIELAAGATFTGNFVLPAKTGDAWITIRAGAGTTLPAFGQRVTPSHASTMPKLVTPNASPALATAAGAHHYRIVGVEIAAAPAVTTAYTLVAFGTAGSGQSTLAQVPRDLVLERAYVHGAGTLDLRRCVTLNSASTAVIDSYLAACHSRTGDSQAIVGWNGPGPFKIANNYLEGAGENVMFGGADPSVADLVPSDIEIRRNHFFKPLAWQSAGWVVKNLLEFKNARRVLVEANVLENSWAGEHSGFALFWKSVNQDGGAPWSTTSDVTFQYNVVRRVAAVLNLSGAAEAHPAVPPTRFRIAHNVFEQVGDATLPSDGKVGRLWQLYEATHVELAHNTGVGTTHGVLLVGAPVSGGLVLRDNVFGGGPGIASADGRGYGTPALDYHVPGWNVRGNVVIGAPASSSAFPGGNLYPSTASEGGLSSDLRVVAAPALGSATTDGLPPGADRTAVEQKTAGVVIR